MAMAKKNKADRAAEKSLAKLLDSSTVNEILSAIANDNARVSVLICVEWLDDALELLLRVKFLTTQLPNVESERLFSSFSSPLYTFGAKVIFSRAFGLLDQETFEVLEAIRSVRNYCAHHKGTVTLENKLADTEKEAAVRKIVLFAERIAGAPAETRQSALVIAVTNIVARVTTTVKTELIPSLEAKHSNSPSDTPPSETQ
jgi:hypothetical protein